MWVARRRRRRRSADAKYVQSPRSLPFLPQTPASASDPPHISTLRFEAQRDGVEDWMLFRAAVNRSSAKSLVAQQVGWGYCWVSDVALACTYTAPPRPAGVRAYAMECECDIAGGYPSGDRRQRSLRGGCVLFASTGCAGPKLGRKIASAESL